MTDLPELRFTPLEEFAVVIEPGAKPLAVTKFGEVVIPAAGIVLVYGSGGAGKTTLVVDLCFALATGVSWLGLVAASRPLRIAIVENEGPRAEFRRKLGSKLETTGADLAGRIAVLDEPWAELTFAEERYRRALALSLVEHEADLLVVGPLVSAGEFPNGGTPDEIHRFEEHIADLRGLVERPFAILLVHHENRAGQVSGAWERLPDTLAHVTAQGNGRTRLFWQKARHSSELHGTSVNLVWADGETYTVEAKPEVTEDSIREDVLAAVRMAPGESWTHQRGLLHADGRRVITGNAKQIEATRDDLLRDGLLVNGAAVSGRYNLYPSDDPAATRSNARTAWERTTSPPAASEPDPNRSPFRSIEGTGERERDDEPQTDRAAEDERLANLAREIQETGT